MKLIKKLLSTLLAIVVILIPMFTIFSYAAYSYNKGDINITLPALGVDTQICSVKKSVSSVYCSKVKFSTDSTFNKAKVWLKNTDGETVSDKVVAYPDGETVRIAYYTDITFIEGASVIYWAEQNNVKSKKAVGTAYAY